jgi:hypothetical protein
VIPRTEDRPALGAPEGAVFSRAPIGKPTFSALSIIDRRSWTDFLLCPIKAGLVCLHLDPSAAGQSPTFQSEGPCLRPNLICNGRRSNRVFASSRAFVIPRTEDHPALGAPESAVFSPAPIEKATFSALSIEDRRSWTDFLLCPIKISLVCPHLDPSTAGQSPTFRSEGPCLRPSLIRTCRKTNRVFAPAGTFVIPRTEPPLRSAPARAPERRLLRGSPLRGGLFCHTPSAVFSPAPIEKATFSALSIEDRRSWTDFLLHPIKAGLVFPHLDLNTAVNRRHLIGGPPLFRGVRSAMGRKSIRFLVTFGTASRLRHACWVTGKPSCQGSMLLYIRSGAIAVVSRP